MPVKATLLPLALALAASCGIAKGVTVESENGVYVLDESSFDTVVNKFPAVLVKFYAPWCGHCKTLAPVFEKAARKLKKNAEEAGTPNGGARLAKVDATVQTELATKYDVKGYPTLAIFKDGAFFGRYEGGRDKDDIVGYMGAMAKPAPMDMVLRSYYLARGMYKEVLRLFLPGAVRKWLIKGLPVVLVLVPLLLAICCRFLCCRGSKKQVKKGEGKAKRPARSESSARDASSSKEGDGSAEGEDKGEESKDAAEKKDD